MSLNGKADSVIKLRGSLSLPDAIVGKSAYEIAVIHGFNGTEEEWLASLKGAKIVSTEQVGQDENGGNIYKQTFDNGHTSTFTAPKGERGEKGEKGENGLDGANYVLTDSDKQEIASIVKNMTAVEWTLTGASHEVVYAWIYISDGKLRSYVEPWYVMESNGTIIGEFSPDSEPFSLSALDTTKTYLVQNGVSTEYYATLVFAEKSTGDDGNWLFKDEYFDSNGRTDLPVPVGGVSYTLFLDGEEICTATAIDMGYQVELDFRTGDDRVWLRCQDYWHFHPIDSQVQSGSVSIRING